MQRKVSKESDLKRLRDIVDRMSELVDEHKALDAERSILCRKILKAEGAPRTHAIDIETGEIRAPA